MNVTPHASLNAPDIFHHPMADIDATMHIKVMFVDCEKKEIPGTMMRIPLSNTDCTVRQFALECLERLARRVRGSVREFVVADVLVNTDGCALFYADRLLDVINYRSEFVLLKLESATVGAIKKVAVARVESANTTRQLQSDERSLDLTAARNGNNTQPAFSDVGFIDDITLGEMKLFETQDEQKRERSNDIAPTPAFPKADAASHGKSMKHRPAHTTPMLQIPRSQKEDESFPPSTKTVPQRKHVDRNLATTPVNLSKLSRDERQHYLESNGIQGWGTAAHQFFPANYDSNGGAKRRPKKRDREEDGIEPAQPVGRKLFVADQPEEPQQAQPKVEETRHEGITFLPFGSAAHGHFDPCWCSDPKEAAKNLALREKILNRPRSPRKTRATCFDLLA